MSSPVKADVNVYDIKIGPLNDAWVNIKWASSEESTGYLVFGEKPDTLNFYVGDANLSRSHSADMTGLKKNQDYYFKIIAVDRNGRENESFLNYLNTKDMKDSRPPVISNFKKIQTTDTYFVASFLTDEKVKTEVYYGLEADNLNKSFRNYSLKTSHEITIQNLKSSTRYYFKIIATDEDGNTSSYYNYFQTANYFSDEIKIEKLIPSSYGSSPIMPERALISFETNLLTTSDIYYGTSPKELKKKEKISTESSLSHQIFLNDLIPDTNYFYQIKLKSSLLRKNFDSPIYSFKTGPLTKEYLASYFSSGDLAKYKSTTYIIYDDNIIPVYSSDKVKEINSEVKIIKESQLNQYTEISPYWGTLHDGQVVKLKNNNTIYLIDGEYKRPIANWQVFSYLNYKASDIVIANSSTLSKYKTDKTINHSNEISSIKNLNNTLVKAPNSTVIYLLVNNKKLPFLSEEAFKKNGYSFSKVIIVNDQFLDSINTGHVII